MPIRSPQEQEYSQIAALYADFFKTHHIFQQDHENIIPYLKQQAREHEFLVHEEKGMIGGALIIVKLGESPDHGHSRWKFWHCAFESEKIAKLLLAEAEQRVKQYSRTAKVELTIAENEEAIDFYKKQEYKQEGLPHHHYRWGEACYILGKSFS